MALDAAITAVFGEPPAGLDLTDNTTSRDDATVITMAILAVLAVAGRMWARHIKAAPLWVDDWLIFVALTFMLITTALSILGGHNKSGYHIWAVDMDQLKTIFKILYGYTFVYGAGASAVKLSFVFYFVRVFHTGPPSTIIYCRDFTSITLVLGIFLALCYPLMVWTTMLGICRPIHYFWDEFTAPDSGSCTNTNEFLLIAGIINMVIDIVILMIPVPPICKLQVRTADKLMLIGIFLLGSFVCIASAMRIHYLLILKSTTDLTWPMGPLFIWSSVEPALGIVSSCLISLRPVFQKLYSSIFGGGDKSANSSPSGKSNGYSRSGNATIGGSSNKSKCRGDLVDDELALVTIDGDVAQRTEAKEGTITVVRDIEIRAGTPGGGAWTNLT
ncbi:hypothetical protein BDV97DRAFT_135102 [Delphinella strobiligena]|nr:hypothetical protein BDV97DRAFT_135102 [Delphinella strobiligena]